MRLRRISPRLICDMPSLVRRIGNESYPIHLLPASRQGASETHPTQSIGYRHPGQVASDEACYPAHLRHAIPGKARRKRISPRLICDMPSRQGASETNPTRHIGYRHPGKARRRRDNTLNLTISDSVRGGVSRTIHNNNVGDVALRYYVSK